MLKKFIYNCEEYILVFSLTLTLGIIFLQVIMRYVFQNSLSWSEELARYIFVWQAWLGASFAVKERKHLKVEAVKKMFSTYGQKIIDLTAYIIWITMSIFLVVNGIKVTSLIASINQLSPAMRMPMALAYASVPIGCLLMTLRLLNEIYLFVRQGT